MIAADPTTGILLSNGDILEASYDTRAVYDKKNRKMVVVSEYNGCFITKPDGQKVWFSNNWHVHIQPLKPSRKDVFL